MGEIGSSPVPNQSSSSSGVLTSLHVSFKVIYGYDLFTKTSYFNFGQQLYFFPSQFAFFCIEQFLIREDLKKIDDNCVRTKPKNFANLCEGKCRKTVPIIFFLF